MQHISLSTFIQAPRARVWETMLGEATYRQWTEAFNPGSYYKGDWNQGSKIVFLGPNPDGSAGEGGLIGRIAESRSPEFVSIEYVGLVANGVEDMQSEEAKKWSGAHENYTFTEKDGGTELLVELDVEDTYKDMMQAMWEKALVKLKEMSEQA